MTMEVRGPNGIVVRFPDGTDAATIDRVMREAVSRSGGTQPQPVARQRLDASGRPVVPGTPEERPPQPAPPAATEPPNALADVAMSLPTGIASGATELLAFPATMQAAGQRGVGWLMTTAEDLARRALGFEPISEEERARRQGIDAEVGPISEAVLRARQNALDWQKENFHQPQTTWGEYARTAGEFIPAAVAVNPQAALSSAMRFGVIPGLVSEGAGQMTEGSDWEGTARFLGGLGGTLVGGVIRSPASFSEAMTGQAASNVSPRQFRDAAQILADARAQGIDLTAPEAIQAATGGGSRLGSVMRMVEGTNEGGARTSPFFAARPGQVQAATSRAARQIAPDTATPSYQGQQLQDAATRAVAGLERQRTAAASPFYDAARTATVPEAEMRAILQNIDAVAGADLTNIVGQRLRDVRGRLIASPARPAVPPQRLAVTGPNGQVIRYDTRPGVPAVPEQPILDIGNLDRARKYFRDILDLPQIGQDAITKEQAAAITDILGRIDRLMLANSADLAAGRAVHQALSESLVNPAAAGPLGRISGTAEVPSQVEALMPRQPLAGSVPETAYAARALAAEAPDAARGVVRQGLERDAQRGMFNTLGLPDEYGGARAAGLLRQNNREANILAAIEETAGRDVRDQVERLTNALAATGWRYRPNSATAFNTEMMQGMKEGGLGGILSSFAKPATAVKDALNRVRLGRQAEGLADLLLSGETGIARIADLAARANERPFRDALLRSAITTPETIGVPALAPSQ